MSPKIKIVTGPIHSGKTTKLFKFINENKNIDGILAPIVNDKRRLYHISTKTIKDLEVNQESRKTISVGKYHFLNESFDWANKLLLKGFKSNVDIIIIDEIGKLELRGEGLHESVAQIMNNIRDTNKKLVIVIRDYLLEEVLQYYSIGPDNYEILNL
ncbi:MAG: nucleoside-triphosphatase [Melioribacteraceae bacterium]|nr:nucleoside-triphosphatase [Melioribacteraceae bacterium]